MDRWSWSGGRQKMRARTKVQRQEREVGGGREGRRQGKSEKGRKDKVKEEREERARDERKVHMTYKYSKFYFTTTIIKITKGTTKNC